MLRCGGRLLIGGWDALAQIGDGKAIGNLTRPEFRDTQAVPFHYGENSVGIVAAFIGQGPCKGDGSISATTLE